MRKENINSGENGSTVREEVLSNFIVIEGLDGAGTTTQLKLIDEELNRIGFPHFCTFEPTEGTIGRLIREILRKKLKAEPDTIALLFAADRNEHLFGEGGIVERIRRGEIVISDRYLFSSLAYQSIQCGFDYVFSLNSKFPLPHDLIFIDTPFEICQKRLGERRNSDIFDMKEFQISVRKNYDKIFDHFGSGAGRGMNIHLIDGSGEAKEVFKDVWKIFQGLPIYKE